MARILPNSGIKVLLQLSPNHSKKDHPWFTEHPEYYVLEESSKVGDSVWRTVDGQQKAWTPTSEGDKSYLHQFHETEPDFNYAEDTLVDEMNVIKNQIILFYISAAKSVIAINF